MATRNRLDAAAKSVTAATFASAADPHRDWDDFLPVGEYCPLDYSECSEHEYERDIQRRLLDAPGLHFSSLVVRRLDNGICVQGVLETSGPHLDLGRIVREISGVENVVNQVVVRECPDAVAEC
ncbi:MAG TPA: hypothetical protein VM452_03300 [Caulifigura sp.]|jgi:hypothetical protein|nr:hypothetical protein [Caulifigura sp.]